MIVIGAGGFAKQLLDSVLSQLKAGENLYFFDNVLNPKSQFLDFPVISSMEDAARIFNTNSARFCLGLAGTTARETLMNDFRNIGGTPTTIVSKAALISQFDTIIGEGCTILGNTIIEPSTRVGRGSLVNVGVSITHDSVVGEFSELGPGTILCGRARVGDHVFIGAGAIILPNVIVGDGAVIAAGAVVNKNVDAHQTVRGVPAK